MLDHRSDDLVTAGYPPRLARIDPRTRTIVGVLRLPAAPWNLVQNLDSLWVRVEGALLRLVPED